MFFLSSSKKRLESWVNQDSGELPTSCTSLGTHHFKKSPIGLKKVEIFAFTTKDGEKHAGFVGPVVWSFWIEGMADEPIEALAKAYHGLLVAMKAQERKQFSIEQSVSEKATAFFHKKMAEEGVDPSKLTITNSITYRVHGSAIYEFTYQADMGDVTIDMKTALNGQDFLSTPGSDPFFRLPQIYFFLGHILAR